MIDDIISLRVLFFLTVFADMRMNQRICRVIHKVVEKNVDNVLLSDK